MSADNGIYILETPITGKKEWRVTHAQAIENLHYQPPKGWDMDPQEVVTYFGKSQVFHSKAEALLRADEMARGFAILEYGIQTIIGERPFEAYQEEAKNE